MNKQSAVFIISQLSSDQKSDREKAMLYLYQQLYSKVQNYISKNSGTAIDAEDVFQDSLVALYKSAKEGKLNKELKLEAYFFTICKNLWLRELSKKRRNTELKDQHEDITNEFTQEAIMITEERNALVDQLIRQIGSNCYKVLRYYYYEKRKMKKIAQLLDLSNEQAAKDKKASCMKKLRKLVRDNPNLIKLLK